MDEELTFNADQWCAITGIRVMDPDGWRYPDRNWEDELTLDEFMDRVAESTVKDIRNFL